MPIVSRRTETVHLTQDAPPPRPFYLTGGEEITVNLDGPALRVEQRDQASTLYPLKRLSRVISSGSIVWSSAALLACATRGVSVTFLNRGGEVVAYLMGTATRDLGLFDHLIGLLDRPDWRDRYDDWYRSMESRARRSVMRRLGWIERGAPVARVESALATAVAQYLGEVPAEQVRRRLSGLFTGLANEILSEVGFGARQAHDIAERLYLARDLAKLLMWDFYPPLLLWLARCTPELPPADAELVTLFQSQSPALIRLGHSIINRLQGFLAELGT